MSGRPSGEENARAPVLRVEWDAQGGLEHAVRDSEPSECDPSRLMRFQIAWKRSRRKSWQSVSSRPAHRQPVRPSATCTTYITRPLVSWCQLGSRCLPTIPFWVPPVVSSSGGRTGRRREHAGRTASTIASLTLVGTRSCGCLANGGDGEALLVGEPVRFNSVEVARWHPRPDDRELHNGMFDVWVSGTQILRPMQIGTAASSRWDGTT